MTVNQIIDGVSSAAAGANVTVSLTNTNGANFTQFDSVPLVLSGTTNSSGQFQVSFTSLTAGQVIGNATANLTVDGVSLTRATGDGQAGELAATISVLNETGFEVTADYWLAYIGIDEAARFLGTTNGEIYNLTSRGEIPWIRWGKRGLRFQRLALRRWMEERKQPAQSRHLVNMR